MTDIQTAVKVVCETPDKDLNRGCAAQFVNLGNGWGFKFYRNANFQEKTYELQKRAASLGLAPEVGEMVTFNLKNRTMYGYTTQTARVIKDEYAASLGCHANEVFDHPNYEEDTRKNVYLIDGYRELMEGLEENGFDTFDMHWGNVGYLDDGRLVAIDFDADIP